jgi:bacterioferritin-associated ferredoxin
VLVCQCKAVSDRAIDAAVAAGARDPRSVVRSTHAGTGCGGCLSTLRALIEDALRPEPCAAPAALAG